MSPLTQAERTVLPRISELQQQHEDEADLNNIECMQARVEEL